jgi:hypothetical protein
VNEPNESRKRAGSSESRPCDQCHGLFRPKTSRHKFCSTVCCLKKHGIGQVNFREQDCETCGTLFRQRRACQRFCSEACRTKHHNSQKARRQNPGSELLVDAGQVYQFKDGAKGGFLERQAPEKPKGGQEVA